MCTTLLAAAFTAGNGALKSRAASSSSVPLPATSTAPAPAAAPVDTGRALGGSRLRTVSNDQTSPNPNPNTAKALDPSATASAFREPAHLSEDNSPTGTARTTAAGAPVATAAPGWGSGVGPSSRMALAAERAVREVDAGGDGAAPPPRVSEGGSDRRLRFNAHEMGASSSASRAQSGGQSFRERVSSALGLGGLFMPRVSGEGLATGPQVEPLGSVTQANSRGVLKKEGTSKQLRLGPGLLEEDEDSAGGQTEDGGGDADDGGYLAVSGGGYKAFKQSGVDAAGMSGAARLAALKAKAVASVAATAAAEAGSRPDSAVVPARLHVTKAVSSGPADFKGLEEELISPSSLLPPGEALEAGERPLLGSRSIRERLVLPTAALTLSAGTGGPPPPPPGYAAAAAHAVAAPSVPLPGMGPAGLRETNSVTFGGVASMTLPPTAAAGPMPPPSLAAGGIGAASRGVSRAPSQFGDALSLAGATSMGATSVAPTSVAPASRVQPSGASTVPAKARSTIKLPIITTGHWDNLVFATVWRVGRVFGFQVGILWALRHMEGPVGVALPQGLREEGLQKGVRKNSERVHERGGGKRASKGPLHLP